MDFNNSSKSYYEWVCIYDDKPWPKPSDFQHHPVELFVVFCVWNIGVSLFATLSNILLIAAIFTSPRLKTPSYSLIASQAYSDLLMALFSMILACFLALAVKNLLSTACYLWHICLFIGRIGAWVSLLSSTLLSIDRYLAVYLGMRYQTIVSLKRVRIAVLLIWLSAPAVSTIYYFFLQSFLLTAIALLVIGTPCFSVMSFCYLEAFRLLRKHSTSSNNSVESTAQEMNQRSPGSLHADTTSNPTCSRLEWKKYRKSIWTLIIVEAVFAIISFPVFCAWVNMFINGDDSDSIVVVGYCYGIWALGSALNPGIHIYRMQDVRQACLAVLVRLRFRMN